MGLVPTAVKLDAVSRISVINLIFDAFQSYRETK